MKSTSLKSKEIIQISKTRLSFKERFANPHEVLNMMSDYIRDGDVANITDLISAYISNSPQYANQEQFAQAIGTTRQTLHRMLCNEAVSMKVFFAAIEQIYDDANE